MTLIDKDAARSLAATLPETRRHLTSGLIAIKPSLDKPYEDAPQWTPWTRFVDHYLKCARNDMDRAAQVILGLLEDLAAAEAKLADVEQYAESLRYKGEFGWGPWQEGHGPDPESAVADDIACRVLHLARADR